MHIFLSYGHDEHAAMAERIKRDLEAHGHQVWFDLDRIKPGGDWERYIEDGLDLAAASPGEGRFLLLMTPHSVRRPDGYCLNELARACHRHLSILPVMLVKVEPPLSISRIQYLDMSDCIPMEDRQERYKSKFEQLLIWIEHNQLDLGGVQARLLNYLDPLPYEAEISQHLVRFTGRDWVVRELDRWMADPRQRVFWITGEAGVGKSALAAWLSAHRPEIAAFHACRYGNSDRVNPRKALTSLAYQLSTQLPDYQQRLNASNLDALRMEVNARAVFERLFIALLGGNGSASEHPLVILIDALDESTENGRNELASIIGTELGKTPPWLRVIVTSRPHEEEVTGPLQGLNPWKLEAEQEENVEDIRSYLRRELLPFTGYSEPFEPTVERIVEKSEGLFLYVTWVRQEIADGRLSLSEVENFPQGLGGIYAAFFERYFPEPEKYRTINRPVLEAICAAREPLKVDYLARLFGLDPEYAETELARAFGSLFPISGGQIRPFHLSVLDWLVDSRRAGNHFVSVVAGHRRLAKYGWEHIADAPDVYTLRYLPSHLEGAQRVDDLHGLLRMERPAAERRENTWYAIKYRAGELDGYLEDIDRAWRQAQSAHDIGLQVRYALCSTSVRSLGDIPSPLLELALRYDVLTWQQALTLARLPKEPAQRAQGLSRLLQLLPEGERRRIATNVFDISNTNKFTDVLPALMPHLPTTLLNGVLEITKNIERDDTRASLLSALMPRLADHELDAASEVADAIRTPLPHVLALGALVPCRSGRQRRRLLAKMSAIARAMPDSAAKVSALCEIAKCEHESLRAKILDRALSTALKLDYSRDLAPALGALATRELSQSQLGNALEFAAETYRVEDHPGTEEAYVSVLFAFGPLMSPDQRTDIVGNFVSRLRSEKSPVFRESTSLLAGILSLYAPQEHQVGLFYELYPYLIRGSIGHDYSFIQQRRRAVALRDWKGEAALRVLSNLPPSLAEIALESVDKISNDNDRADILCAIVPNLRQERRAQVLSAEVARDSIIGDTLARTQALASLTKHMPRNQRAGLAETLLHTADAMGQYRFRAIATLVPCLREARAARFVRRALLAIRDSEPRSRRSPLIELAPVLKSEISDALQIAEELEAVDYPALAALVPYLPIDQRHDLIDKCLKAAQGWVAVELPEDFVAALKTLIEYMDRAQLTDAWKIGKTLRDQQRADVITVLAPRLDGHQIEEAASTLHKMPNNDWTARAWAALAPRLSGSEQSAALSEALKAVNDPAIRLPCVRTLPVLLPQLDKDERINVTSHALRRALSIDEDDRRAATLCSLVPCLPSASRLTAIEELLTSCTGTKVVMTIGSSRIQRGLDREFLLQQIADLADTLAEMSGETVVSELASAISDGTAWWA